MIDDIIKTIKMKYIINISDGGKYMVIDNTKLILVALWISLMLVYLLGDVLRIFSGSFVAGEIDGVPVSDTMWFVSAVIMVIPIIMIILTLLLPTEASKWVNIVVAIAFFLFNAAGFVGYKSFDKLLLLVSFIFNFMTVYFAWIWH